MDILKIIESVKEEIINIDCDIPKEVVDLTLATLIPAFKTEQFKKEPKEMPDVIFGNDFVFSKNHPLAMYDDGSHLGPLVQINLAKINQIYNIWEKDLVLQLYISDPDFWGQGFIDNISQSCLHYELINSKEAESLWSSGSTSRHIDITKAYKESDIEESDQEKYGVSWEYPPVNKYLSNAEIVSITHFPMDPNDVEDMEEEEEVYKFYSLVDKIIEKKLAQISTKIKRNKTIPVYNWPDDYHTLSQFEVFDIIKGKKNPNSLIPLINFSGACSGTFVDKYSVYFDLTKKDFLVSHDRYY